MEGELRISKGSVFQMVGAATAKLREPKHVYALLPGIVMGEVSLHTAN